MTVTRSMPVMLTNCSHYEGGWKTLAASSRTVRNHSQLDPDLARDAERLRHPSGHLRKLSSSNRTAAG